MLAQFGLIEISTRSAAIGQQFGRLKVLATGKPPNSYRYQAICQCECGSPPRPVRIDGLTSGAVLSCGCIRRESALTHGMTGHLGYLRWRHMMDRCYNPRNPAYPNYGGRGITVCADWHDVATFISQLPDGYFDGAELDRIDNDGDYRPGNVRWATRTENANNRRSIRLLTFRGETLSMRDWSRRLGIEERLIHSRICKLGWSVDRALTEPPVEARDALAKARQARWGSHQKQQPKTNRRVHRLEYQGQSRTIAEISAICGVPAKLLRKRLLERGWTLERATSG